MDTSDGPPSKPMSIKEISDKASEYEWNPNIEFKYWVRAADTIYREGTNYLREGNFTNAYFFYVRYSTLVLDHVGKHPDAKKPESKAALRPLLKRMPVIFEQLEQLKPDIDRAYERWQQLSTVQRSAREPQKPLSEYQKRAANDPALSWNPAARAKVLDAGENQELAVDLARKEIRRRDAARKATRQAGISFEEEQRRRGAGVWEDWDGFTHSGSSQRHSQRSEEQELRDDMEATRRMLSQGDGQDHSREESETHRSREQPSSRSYHYPSISKPAPLQYPSSSARSQQELHAPQPPTRPPKESLPRPPPYRFDSPPPPSPGKGSPPPPSYEPPTYEALTPALSDGAPPKRPPKTADRDSKHERYTFRPAAYLESGKPIRPVFLPDKLRKTFLELAADHTRQGLEMCGILCGTPVNNALFISCLLIPEQKCTSDTCETENESAMLDYCINQDLLMIGWIHTHPTQTCFMSSRDLHTQAGYQVMMPESIAIVCAPSHTPSWGIFRLTDPPGLPHILHCSHTDTFHQHSIENIYTDASHPPGHVYETSRMDFYVHDLRPKR